MGARDGEGRVGGGMPGSCRQELDWGAREAPGNETAVAPRTRSRVYTGISCAFFFAPFPFLELIFWKIKKQRQTERERGGRGEERRQRGGQGPGQAPRHGEAAGFREVLYTHTHTHRHSHACTCAQAGCSSWHSRAPSHFGHPRGRGQTQPLARLWVGNRGWRRAPDPQASKLSVSWPRARGNVWRASSLPSISEQV